MKTRERAFVLYRTPYSETSSILKCFSEKFGLKSFLLKGARKKHANLIQALSYIEFTFHHKENDQLATMFDVNHFYQANSLQFHPLKTSLIFFQNEILKNVLIDGQIDEELFHFISEEYQWLNEEEYFPNYIIYWLFCLINILGFDPLEMEENETKSKFLTQFSGFKREYWQKTVFPKEERQILLNNLLNYFQEKIPNFTTPKSLDVFHTIWYE